MTALIVRAGATREFLSSAIEHSIEYRDGNKVIRPINPCILARYDKTTETDCVDGVGWMGIPAETKGNAIALARKPAYDELLKKFSNTLIHTSGPFVGLPEGQMGNSEVGHMNMGAGRIVHMDITRIDLLIANKQLQNVPLFQQAMERGRARQLHFLGFIGDAR